MLINIASFLLLETKSVARGELSSTLINNEMDTELLSCTVWIKISSANAGEGAEFRLVLNDSDVKHFYKINCKSRKI